MIKAIEAELPIAFRLKFNQSKNGPNRSVTTKIRSDLLSTVLC